MSNTTPTDGAVKAAEAIHKKPQRFMDPFRNEERLDEWHDRVNKTALIIDSHLAPTPKADRLDLSKYEGLTEGPWVIKKTDTADGPYATIETKFPLTDEVITQLIGRAWAGDRMDYINHGDAGPNARAIAALPEIIPALKSAYAELDARVAKGPYRVGMQGGCHCVFVPDGMILLFGEDDEALVALVAHSLNSKEREIGRLEGGLRFYGDKDNWGGFALGDSDVIDKTDVSMVESDDPNIDEEGCGGKRARNLLAKQNTRRSRDG